MCGPAQSQVNYSHRKDCKQMRKLMLKPQKQMLTTMTAMMATISTLAMMALMVLVLVPMLMLMAV